MSFMLVPLTIVTTSLLWKYRRKLSMGAGYARLAWRRWRRPAPLKTTIVVAATPRASEFNVQDAALSMDMDSDDMDLDDMDMDSDEEDEALPPASPGSPR